MKFTPHNLLMYGISLKVSPPELTPDDKKEIERLKKRADVLREKLKTLEGDETQQERADTKSLLNETVAGIRSLSKGDQSSSVDSEIALVQNENYDLSGWLPNPQFIGYRSKKNLPYARKSPDGILP